jgi:CheY-like chemotaxis protein
LYSQHTVGGFLSTEHVRVLVVDGEENTRLGLFRALLDREIFCDCVASGGEAIARLGEQRYALVILDFSLPRAGAAAVTESIRAMDDADRPMVIATATTATSCDDETGLVQMILRRPARVRDVADLVAACLAQVRTTWPAARNAETPRSSRRSGTST